MVAVVNDVRELTEDYAYRLEINADEHNPPLSPVWFCEVCEDARQLEERITRVGVVRSIVYRCCGCDAVGEPMTWFDRKLADELMPL